MPATELVAELERILEPAILEHGLELVAVEQSGGRHAPIIRVLLDRDGGIDVDTIAASNRWISEVLEADEHLKGPYILEVSSPGIDRPLTKPADYVRFSGETATIKTRTATGRATLTGQISSANESGITLVIEGNKHQISYNDILKARLKGAVDFGTEGSAKTR
jgi:ribosome maturation factor RimP